MIGNICPSRVELVTMVPRTSILFPTSITGFCGGVRMAIITDFSFHLRFPRVAEPPYFWQPIAVDSFKCLWARDVINDANHICLWECQPFEKCKRGGTLLISCSICSLSVFFAIEDWRSQQQYLNSAHYKMCQLSACCTCCLWWY